MASPSFGDAINRPQGGGLWLPAHYARRRTPIADPRLSMMGVIVGHEICLGERRSLEHIVELLDGCDPLGVIDLVTKTNIMLGRPRLPTDMKVQATLACCFWNRDKATSIL